MNLIEVMYGKELFDRANCSVHVLVTPCNLFNSFLSEMHIESAARKQDIPVERNAFHGQYSAWGEDARSDLGKWTKASYDVADGMLIKIWVHKTTGFGNRIINVSQFIRPRKDAAFREIKVILTRHPKSRFEFATIKGRFDLISLEDAKKRGAKINSRFEYTFNPDDFAAVTQCTELEPEKAPSALIRETKVRKRNGETVVVRRRRVARALNLGKDD